MTISPSEKLLLERVSNQHTIENVLLTRAKDYALWDGKTEAMQAEQWKVTCLKVISIASFCIIAMAAFLMPTLAYFQQPAWIFYGLGLPGSLILLIVGLVIKSVADQKIEKRERLQDRYRYLRQMTQESTFKIPRSTVEFDEHLKADRKVRDTGIMGLKVPLPKTTGEVERLAGLRSSSDRLCVDLEVVTTNLKPNLCYELTSTDKEDKWPGIISLVGKAHADLLQGKEATFKSDLISAKRQAYFMPILSGFPHLDRIPRLSKREELQELRQQYTIFCQIYGGLEKLHQEGMVLLGKPHFAWEHYFEGVKELYNRMDPFLREERSIEEIKEIKYLLALQLRGARLVREALEAWIQQHPNHRFEGIQREFIALERRVISRDPCKEDFSDAQKFIETLLGRSLTSDEKKRHEPHLRNLIQGILQRKPIDKQAILRFLKDISGKEVDENQFLRTFPELEGKILVWERFTGAEIQRWVEGEHRPSDPERDWTARGMLRKASRANILERNKRMRSALDEAKNAFRKVESQFPMPSSISRKEKGKGPASPQLSPRDVMKESMENPRNFQTDEELQKAIAEKERVLDEFEREYLGDLKIVINNRIGEKTHWSAFKKEVFTFLPPKPFDKPTLDRKDPFILRHQKVEQIQIQRLLKKMDQNFNRLNFGFLMTRSAMMIGLLLTTAIFTNVIWVHFGLVGGFLALTALSMYVNYRLKLVHRNMEEQKLRRYFYEHPLMTQTAGNRPILKELKRVQQEYGLDGTASTRAKIAVHGEKVTKSFAQLAKEGQKRAAAALKYADFSPRIEELDQQATEKAQVIPTLQRNKEYERLVKDCDETVKERIKLERELDKYWVTAVNRRNAIEKNNKRLSNLARIEKELTQKKNEELPTKAEEERARLEEKFNHITMRIAEERKRINENLYKLSLGEEFAKDVMADLKAQLIQKQAEIKRLTVEIEKKRGSLLKRG